MNYPSSLSGGILRRFALAAVLLGSISVSRADTTPAAAPGLPDDDSIRATLRLVAARQIRPLKEGDYTSVENLAALQKAAAPQGLTWAYPWGVTLYGALRSTDATGDARVEAFVLEHNRSAARYYTFLEATRAKIGPAEMKSFRSRISGLMNLGNLDSCGAMGVAMIEGVLRHPESATPEEKAVVARIGDWITNRQERLPDGTLWRPRSDGGAKAWKAGTLWLDDLYMACPFLVRWARYTGDSRHLDDAARQIINMATRLQDRDGVWFHTYFENEGKHSPFKWGRANGWGVVATVEVLSAMPESHPLRGKLLDILRRQLEGIKALQAPDGMWHQVLDHPELWEETSCTAMFAYGFARAANRGWIDASGLTIARKAFAGLQAHITAEGSVNGTCEGTNIGLELDYYANRKRPDDDLHGRGVVLLAGTEILAARK